MQRHRRAPRAARSNMEQQNNQGPGKDRTTKPFGFFYSLFKYCTVKNKYAFSSTRQGWSPSPWGVLVTPFIHPWFYSKTSPMPPTHLHPYYPRLPQ